MKLMTSRPSWTPTRPQNFFTKNRVDGVGLYTDLLAVVGVRAVEELDAREGASELAAAGDPGDSGALVEEEAGVEELDALLLDEAHAQHLALLLVRDQLCGQHLHAYSDITAVCIVGIIDIVRTHTLQ